MWNGFETEEFEFCGRKAMIIFPKGEPNGKLLLKTEYLDAFPNFEIEMLNRGYYSCFVSHPTRWAPDSETIIMADFVKYVAEKLSIEPKCIPVGMSCGGLQAVRLAEMFPELISVLYIDAPVLNLLSLAGLGAGACEDTEAFWREMSKAHGFDKSSIVNFRHSPIDHMDILIKNDIPVVMVYGDVDHVVLYEENGKVLKEYYEENGGKIKVICKNGCDHHPHCLDDVTPIVEFVEKYI